MYRTILTTVLAIVPIANSSFSAVPPLINYQGRLTDTGGDPVGDSAHSVMFTIYDAAAGGNSKWTETQSVNTTGGLFAVLLGSINPIIDTVFDQSPRYLGVKVGSDPEMSPRTMLVTIPWSYRVNSVDGALGGDIITKVSIGPGNVNTGTDAFVAGSNNRARGNYSVVSGGGGPNVADSNAALGDYSTIGGGRNNRIATTGTYSTIGGGYVNRASGSYVTIGGGETNVASGWNATVGGGRANIASGDDATVGGGANNTASYYYSTVGGGTSNTASEQYSTVAGGANNNATGMAATVSGGDVNAASGQWATVPGGIWNIAAGDYSFAAGRRARANHRGTFVWGDSTNADFATTGANQFIIRASGGVGIGTNSPSARLHVKGAGFPSSFGYFDTDANSQDAGLRFYEAGIVKSHLFHHANTNTLNLYGEGYSGISVTSTGSVGIGTTSPTQKLYVAGNICATGTIGACSDARFKRLIRPYQNALEKINKLRGVTYQWNREQYPQFAEGDQIGFIAQEVKVILPEAVSEGSDGTLSVDYGRVSVLLLEAIKEQQRKIEQLEQRLNEVEILQASSH